MAKRKKKELSGLAAALVKAGHMDDKKARKLQRERKREDKGLGTEGVEARKAEERAATEERSADRAEVERERERSTTSAEVQTLVRSEAESGWQGRRRWFYVRRDQRLSYFDLSDEVARLLRGGQIAIVEGFGSDEGSHFLLKDALLIGRVRAEDPTHVRFWNQEGASE
ncbi:MAG: DUF2058 family protein [Planctomycetes bacterium]|nr:DUF2058 family protein [Planctomycetota bacterium]